MAGSSVPRETFTPSGSPRTSRTSTRQRKSGRATRGRGGLALEKCSRSRCLCGATVPRGTSPRNSSKSQKAATRDEPSRECSTWNIGRRLQELSCIILGADFGEPHIMTCLWVCSPGSNGTRSGSRRAMQNVHTARLHPKTQGDVPRGTSRVPKHRAAPRRLSTSRATTGLCLETHRGCSTWNKGTSQRESPNGERADTTLREQEFNGPRFIPRTQKLAAKMFQVEHLRGVLRSGWGLGGYAPIRVFSSRRE